MSSVFVTESTTCLFWWSQCAEYRSSRARWDVEQRNSIFGALRNGVVLRNRIKWLEVHQHLISLIDTTRIHGACRSVTTRSELNTSISLKRLVVILKHSLCECSTSAACSKSGGWQRCGMDWWWVSSGYSWCHAGCHSSPPSSPLPWCFSSWGPMARGPLPSTQCACCVSTTVPALPPAESHLQKKTNKTPQIYENEHFRHLRLLEERTLTYLWWGWSL